MVKATRSNPKKPSGSAQQEPPAVMDLAKFSETPEGKELIAMALALRERAQKLNLPITTTIAGVAPFGQEFIALTKQTVMNNLQRIIFGQ